MKNPSSNEPSLPTDNLENNAAGIIYAANENRFDAAHYSQPLTAYTAGWQDPNQLDLLLDFLAPPIPVGRRFEFKKGINKEYFLSDDDDIRAIGASFKRIEVHGETVNEKTINKGLTLRVDHDEIADEGDDWRERRVNLLLKRLHRNELRRVVSLITAAASAANKTWNSTSNPDGDLRSILSTAADASGIRPNRIAIGEGPWDIRANVYEDKNMPYAGRAAQMTPEELAAKLGIEQIRILSARYQSSSSAKSKVLPNILFFYAEDGLTKDEPSNIKRFITPTDSGNYKVYIKEHEKFTDLTVEHYSQAIVTSSLGLMKSTISTS